MLILGTLQTVHSFFFSCKYFVFVIRTKLKPCKFNTTTVDILQSVNFSHAQPLRLNMQESDKDHDYPPDDESFGDNDSSDVTLKDKRVKSGKLKPSRNLENEFVFDKEWAFNRMCTLESLLSARLLSSTSKNFTSVRNSTSHQHGKECKNNSCLLDAEKSCFQDFCVNQSIKKKEDDLLTGYKSHTAESSKSRYAKKPVEHSKRRTHSSVF